MTKIQVFGILLLIALIFTMGLHAQSTNDTSNLKLAKADISWSCTAKCASWWKCRIFSFFLSKCSKPGGCDCSRFAWEH